MILVLSVPKDAITPSVTPLILTTSKVFNSILGPITDSFNKDMSACVSTSSVQLYFE